MKKRIIFFIGVVLIIPIMVFAAPPEKPGNQESVNVTYKGATSFFSNQEENSKTYSSTTGGENSILVSNGEVTLTDSVVKKTGDENSENSDFYGTNAGILVYNNANLSFRGGEITTNGSHANAVFAIGTGKINISNTIVTTTGNNSGGVMVTGGGTIDAKNLTVKTSGNSSAAIRSDRGGGTLTVEEGQYETSGVGSPAIYSTADITVTNASLLSTSSEGIVIEGANSVTLNNATVTDTNTTLNGNSETYKNIFLYQSMSGDADVGKSIFTAKDSTIITNRGDTFFVTNTKAEINLEGNAFFNNDGDFLRIQTGKWGTSGSNGGEVTLTAIDQIINGNIIVDSISTLDVSLKGESKFIGSIDSENQAKNVSLTIAKDTILSLTKDTYLDSFVNEDSENNNVYSNGNKLIVNGEEITINQGTYEEEKDSGVKAEEGSSSFESFLSTYKVAFIVLALGIILLLIALFKKRNQIKKESEKKE